MGDKNELTDAEREVARRSGTSEEEFLKYKGLVKEKPSGGPDTRPRTGSPLEEPSWGKGKSIQPAPSFQKTCFERSG